MDARMEKYAMDVATDPPGTWSPLGKSVAQDRVYWAQTQYSFTDVLQKEAEADRTELRAQHPSDMMDEEPYNPYPGFELDRDRPRPRPAHGSVQQDPRKVRPGTPDTPPSISHSSYRRENQDTMTSLIAIANEASRTVAEQRHHREQRELARRSRVDDRRTTRSAGPAAGAHCSTVPSVRHGVRRGSSGKVSKTIAKRKPHRGRSATPAGDDGADAMVTDSDSVLYSKARAQTSGTRVPTSKPSAPPVPIEPPAQWPSQKTPPGLAIVAFTASPAGPSTSPPRNSPPFLPVTPPADDPRPTHRKGTAVAPSSTPPLSAPRSRSTRPTSERPVRKDVRLGLGRKVMSAVYTPSQTLPLKQKPFKAPLVRPHPAKAAPETILQPHPAHRPAPTPLVTTARASLPKNAAPITPEDSQPRLLRSSADDEDEDMEETKEADSSYGELGIDPEAVEEAMKPHD